MAINKQWTPAIIESAVKHFDAQAVVHNLAIHYEASRLPKEEEGEWIEFRYIGPDYLPHAGKDNYRVRLVIDVLIQTPSGDDIYRLPTLEGIVAEMFTCFDVALEDGTSIGTAALPGDFSGEIETTQLHANLDLPLQHSSISATYELVV